MLTYLTSYTNNCHVLYNLYSETETQPLEALEIWSGKCMERISCKARKSIEEVPENVEERFLMIVIN